MRAVATRNATKGLDASIARLPETLTSAEYRRLAAFRFALRSFLQFSAAAAQAAGLTTTQHQALLSIKGHPAEARITIGELAEHLLVAPHSAAELVARLEGEGLVTKRTDPADRRKIGLELTAKAERTLHHLSEEHLAEVRVMAPGLIETLIGLLPETTPMPETTAARG